MDSRLRGNDTLTGCSFYSLFVVHWKNHALITPCQRGRDMITLKPIKDPYIGHLAGILNSDNVLCDLLSQNKEHITPKHFLEHNAEWAKSTNSEMYAIVLDGAAIGMISLSHIDKAHKTAQVGYWMTSKLWNKGYTSAAFGKILAKGRRAGIASVSATVDGDNAASKAIWLRNGATFAQDNGKIKASLKL
jgi:[ribosomal protein S5]-alanine N-acetyltransferase